MAKSIHSSTLFCGNQSKCHSSNCIHLPTCRHPSSVFFANRFRSAACQKIQLPPGGSQGVVAVSCPHSTFRSVPSASGSASCRPLQRGGFMHQRIGTRFVASLKTGCPEAARLFYLLLLLVRCSEYCLMEEILLSDSDIKAFSFSSNSWSAVLGAAF